MTRALTKLDPNNPAVIVASVGDASAGSGTGEVLNADKVEAINTFDAPNQVTLRPVPAKAREGKLELQPATAFGNGDQPGHLRPDRHQHPGMQKRPVRQCRTGRFVS